jgi:PAS domain-containing protein
LGDRPTASCNSLRAPALNLCRAHSAGLSLLEEGDQKRNFHWRAIAGQWAPHRGGGTPREFGPCGTVLDRNAAQLLSHPELDFPYFGEVTPCVADGLLIPFYIAGEAVGTIWIIAHDGRRRFDAEDLRLMTNLATFAGTAYQMVLTLNATNKANQELQKTAAALQRFASIVESPEEAIISKNLDGVITSWNNGAERIFWLPAPKLADLSAPFPKQDARYPTCLCRRRGRPVTLPTIVPRFGEQPLFHIFDCVGCGFIDWIRQPTEARRMSEL